MADLEAVLMELVGSRDPSEMSLQEVVDLGARLTLMMRRLKEAQDKIKGKLREEARKQLKNKPGQVTLEGAEFQVQVSVPEPRAVLQPKADVDLLKKVLGDDFDIYFEETRTYKPRAATPDLILNLPVGVKRTLLLDAVAEKEGTPRVSFKV